MTTNKTNPDAEDCRVTPSSTPQKIPSCGGVARSDGVGAILTQPDLDRSHANLVQS